MNLPVVFSRRAIADAIEAANWFDEQRPGLGDDFIGELRQAIRLVSQFPASCQPFRNSLRRALIHRFGFAVVYQISTSTIEIVAVMHCRRQDALEKRVPKLPGTMEQ